MRQCRFFEAFGRCLVAVNLPVVLLGGSSAKPGKVRREKVSMKLVQLEYFCAVCRYHSITRAAEELYVTQPTISVAIRELEKEPQGT